MTSAKRIDDGAELGKDQRWADIALGSAAVAPLVGAGMDVWLTGAAALEVGLLATLWSGGLLLFFAGVRRGLTFSEPGGGRPFELFTMVWLFCLGMLTVILTSLPAAILGLVSVGVLDFWAARAQEAPAYFRIFRPLQMGLSAAALLLILVRDLPST